MPDSQTLLLTAVRQAPRRWRMPPLPGDAQAAAAAGPEAALAYALEAVRRGENGADIEDLFTSALARLLQAAVAPGADAALQALVLRTQDPTVAEYVELREAGVVQASAVRASVDAIAHPGKLRRRPAGALRDALAGLHEAARAAAWGELAARAGRLLESADLGGELREPLRAIRSHPALPALERAIALEAQPAVQRYEALRRQRGPLAGSAAAAAQGRAHAQRGDRAELATVQAFAAICALLNEGAPGAPLRAVHGLRSPARSAGPGSKQEWDAAIVRGAGTRQEPADLLLLAEVKAAPAAAIPDLPRLLRGLRLLAGAGTCELHAQGGPLHLSGASLQPLQPQGDTLPPQVIYCCDADGREAPPLLASAGKAVLLGQPASLAFAGRLLRGEAADPRGLASLWRLLAVSPHLRSTLHQYALGEAVCAAMLQPADLRATVAALAGGA